MMYDFRDVITSSKEEQVRAWAVEQAIEFYPEGTHEDKIVRAAAKIENYIKNGSSNDET